MSAGGTIPRLTSAVDQNQAAHIGGRRVGNNASDLRTNCVRREKTKEVVHKKSALLFPSTTAGSFTTDAIKSASRDAHSAGV